MHGMGRTLIVALLCGLYSGDASSFSIKKIDLSKATDKQISEELLSEKWHAVIDPTRKPSELKEIAGYTAKLLAELHKRRKHDKKKIKSLYKNEQGMIGLLFRKLGKLPTLNGPAELSFRPEQYFEWQLSKAIADSEPKQDPCEVICQFVANYGSSDKEKNWKYLPKQLPFISGAEQIKNSWSFSLFAIQATLLSQTRGICKKAPAKNVKEAIARWLDHPYVKYRQHSGKKTKQAQVLLEVPNSPRTWGMVFSNLLLKDFLGSNELRTHLPKVLKDEISNKDFAVDSSFLKRTSEKLEENLSYRFLRRKKLEQDKFLNSHLTFHLVGNILGALSPKSAKAFTQEFTTEVEKLQKDSKSNELQLPYKLTPGYLPETERASAARGAPFRFSELKNLGYSRKRLDRLVNTLVNFALYSGSLIIHLSRNDAHWGGDNLAPYYWPPTLPVVAAGFSLAAQLAQKLGSKALIAKIEWAQNLFELTLKAQFDRKKGLFSSPGTQTYGANPKAWAGTFQALGLVPACLKQKGISSLGIFHSIVGEDLGKWLASVKENKSLRRDLGKIPHKAKKPASPKDAHSTEKPAPTLIFRTR